MALRHFASLLFLTAALALAGCGQGEFKPAGPFEEPTQVELSSLKPLRHTSDFEFWAMDEYIVEAMVMSRKRYRWDTEAELSPVDLLLAWGPVTEEPYLSAVKWSQSGRWGFYEYRNASGVRANVIARNSANTHIIPEPGNSSLRRELLRLRRGDVVRLEGYLVRVEREDGWKWVSSRSRTDTGAGACEVFYVTYVEKLY